MEQEVFWSIAVQLQADRRWAGRILWIRIFARPMSVLMRIIMFMAPAAGMWIL